MITVFKTHKEKELELCKLFEELLDKHKHLLKEEESRTKELRKAYGASLEFQIRLGKKPFANCQKK